MDEENDAKIREEEQTFQQQLGALFFHVYFSFCCEWIPVGLMNNVIRHNRWEKERENKEHKV